MEARLAVPIMHVLFAVLVEGRFVGKIKMLIVRRIPRSLVHGTPVVKWSRRWAIKLPAGQRRSWPKPMRTHLPAPSDWKCWLNGKSLSRRHSVWTVEPGRKVDVEFGGYGA